MRIETRSLAAATVGGVSSGLAVGALARADMRLVALLRGQVPEFSIGGTGGVLMVFMVMSLALAAGYVVWASRRPLERLGRIVSWSIPGTLLFLAVLLLTPLRQELGAGQEILLFAPIAVLLGPLAAWPTARAVRALPEAQSSLRRIGYRLLAAPAVLALVLLPLLLIFGMLQLSGVIPVPPE